MTLTNDTEQDPLSRESNLVMFAHPVTRIRLRGNTDVVIHPIRVSHEPIKVKVASTGTVDRPLIYSRNEWGANDALLYTNAPPPDASTPTEDASDNDTGNGNGNGGSASSVSDRVRNCDLAQQFYPDEFKTVNRVTGDLSGKRYRWPQDHSPSVKLLVVHHTAVRVEGDSRPGAERMQAIYQYHSQTKGWGDIGYHYVIDEKGFIFEGRAGGAGVVGGHAWCNNVGTIGISLMGNFEQEQPSQTQVKSLQWLLDLLANQYSIDLTRNTTYHGKSMPPVVGHRDLLSTTCPGYYMYGVMDQVRSHLRTGDLFASVVFPPPRSSSSSRSSQPRIPVRQGLTPVGATALTGRPGGELTVTLRYQAGNKLVRRGQKLANITRSNPKIGVWVAKEDRYLRSRTTLLSPVAIGANQASTIRVKIQFPRDRGTHSLRIGDVTYSLTTEGRSIPAPRTPPTRQTYTPPASSSSSYSQSSSSSTNNYKQPTPLPPSGEGDGGGSSSSLSMNGNSPLIRIRLTDKQDPPPDTMTVSLPGSGLVNGSSVSASTIQLQKDGDYCVVVSPSGIDGGQGVIRIDPLGRILTVTSMVKAQKRYRGVLECRVVDNTLTLINELPLEDYMLGLAEEPDTEPWEKQRAFAVAARTYAAYYMDPAHRKFPGKPFDGSDNPAEFQVYGGAAFEESNPQWVQAVKLTGGQVLKKDGLILRAPYFSTDDGRTRSPAEAGWPNFPFAEVFVSKPDPWCQGMSMRGHGVGMSGCGARGQAYEGKTYSEILQYYYPGTVIDQFDK